MSDVVVDLDIPLQGGLAVSETADLVSLSIAPANLAAATSLAGGDMLLAGVSDVPKKITLANLGTSLQSLVWAVLDVDYLRLNGNTISNTNVAVDANSKIIINPPAYIAGYGQVEIGTSAGAISNYLAIWGNTSARSFFVGVDGPNTYLSAYGGHLYLRAINSNGSLFLAPHNTGGVFAGDLTNGAFLAIGQSGTSTLDRHLYIYSGTAGKYLDLYCWANTGCGLTGAAGGTMTISSGWALVIGAAATQPVYFDAGGLFYWRDKDGASATRMTLDSATGNLVITGTASATDITATKVGAPTVSCLSTTASGADIRMFANAQYDGTVGTWTDHDLKLSRNQVTKATIGASALNVVDDVSLGSNGTANRQIVMYGGTSGRYSNWQQNTQMVIQAQGATNPIFLNSASSYIVIASGAASAQYFDCGGLFSWRDVDATNATRMSLDSATGAFELAGVATTNANSNSITAPIVMKNASDGTSAGSAIQFRFGSANNLGGQLLQGYNSGAYLAVTIGSTEVQRWTSALSNISYPNLPTDGAGNLNIYTTDAFAIDKGGKIGLGGKSGVPTYVFGTIRGAKENATDGNYAGYLSFSTTNNLSTVVERMRIGSDGNTVHTGTAGVLNGTVKVTNGSNADYCYLDSTNGLGLSRSTAYIRNILVGGKTYFSTSAVTANDTIAFGIENTSGIFVGSDAGGARAITIHSGTTNRPTIIATNTAGTCSITTGGNAALITAADGIMYFDAGNIFYWRDKDATNATRMTLDSATGNLGVSGKLYVGPGLGTATAPVHVIQTGGVVDGINCAMILDYESDTAITTGGTSLEFRGKSAGGNLVAHQQGRIRTYGLTSDNAHGLIFDVRTNAGSGLVEGMRLTQQGVLDVLLGLRIAGVTRLDNLGNATLAAIASTVNLTTATGQIGCNFATSLTASATHSGYGYASSTILNVFQNGFNLTNSLGWIASEVIAKARSATGTITGVAGLRSGVQNLAGGIVTNAYGIKIDSGLNSGGGTITNLYGLYIATQTAGATLNYSLFVEGGASHLGGDVRVGTDAAGARTFTMHSGTTTRSLVMSTDAGGNAYILQGGGNLTLGGGYSTIFRSTQPFYFNDASSVTRMTIDAVNGDVGVTGAVTGPKFKITPEGGYAIKLTNKTGGTSVPGRILTMSSTTNNAYEQAAAGEDFPFGICYDAVAADAEGWVVVAGIADVDYASAPSRDSVVFCGATAGRASSATTLPGVTDHNREIGHVLSATATSGTLYKTVLHFN